MIGNIIDDKEVQDKVGYDKYDIVVANILADVLVPLTPVILNQLKKGGVYITSGIIDDKEDTVVEAVKAAGLEVLEVTYQGEWYLLPQEKISKKEDRRTCSIFFVVPDQVRDGYIEITGSDAII